MEKIKIQDINNTVNSCISKIKNSFRTVGEKNGWHQHLGSNKVGNTATAQGLILLKLFNVDFDKKHLALETLKNTQFNDSNPQIDGGWAYVSNLSNIPTTESTVWALKGLYTQYNSTDIHIKKGVEWLKNNIIESNRDTGWGSIKKDISKVYTTCMVLDVLRLLGETNCPEYEKGLNWLKQSQNSDFGWGEKVGSTSSVTHTSYALNTLIDSGLPLQSDIIINGVQWLTNSFREENFWINTRNGGLSEFMDIEIETGTGTGTGVQHHRITYYHFSTPYAIIALIKAGYILNPVVFKALNYLVESNIHGRWQHPYISDSSIHPIWAIYDSLLAFKHVQDNSFNWSSLNYITLKRGTVRFKYRNRDFSISEFFNSYIITKPVIASLLLIPLIAFLNYIEISKFITNYPILSIVIFPLIISISAGLITGMKNERGTIE